MIDAIQATVRTLLEDLRALDPETILARSLVNPGSYRGYHEDIYFTLSDQVITVAKQLDIVEEMVVNKIQSFKGEAFFVTPSTPIWIARGSSDLSGIELYGVCPVRGIVTSLSFED